MSLLKKAEEIISLPSECAFTNSNHPLPTRPFSDCYLRPSSLYARHTSMNLPSKKEGLGFPQASLTAMIPGARDTTVADFDSLIIICRNIHDISC